MERVPLDREALWSAVGHRWVRVQVVDETQSTNADLLADVGAPDRSVLVAEYQRAGRGRLERSWVSPARAGLTLSALLRPRAPIATWGWLPLLAGVAVRSAVAEAAEAAGPDVVLKWPNDVLAGPSQLKIAGILAQTSGEAVVIGVGLNVTTTADELPAGTATSLALLGAVSLDRTALTVAVLERLDARLAQWEDCRGDAEACGLADAYREICATLGRRVTVHSTDGAVLTGTATAIDSGGRLRIDVDGRERVVGAGDVEHLRPG